MGGAWRLRRALRQEEVKFKAAPGLETRLFLGLGISFIAEVSERGTDSQSKI